MDTKFVVIGYSRTDIEIKVFNSEELSEAMTYYSHFTRFENIELHELNIATNKTTQLGWYDRQDEQWLSTKTVTKTLKITKHVPLGKEEWDVTFPVGEEIK